MLPLIGILHYMDSKIRRGKSENVKLFGVGVALAFIFTLGFEKTSVDAASLHVKSTEVPSETTVLATQHWQDYLNRMLATENRTSSDYYLGQPFTISYPTSVTFSYPVIAKENKQISYLLQIDSSDSQNPDGFMLSKALAKKLEEVSLTVSTNNKQPIQLDGINQNVYYDYMEVKQPLLTINSTDIPSDNLSSLSTNTVDITEPTAQPNIRSGRSSISFDTKILPWAVYEIQKDQPWCQYFTMAGAINYQAGKQITSASDLIHKTYPTATEQQLMDAEWVSQNYVSNVINYVNKAYNYSIKLDSNALPFSTIKNEISNNSPVIVALKSGVDYGHSIALIGYTAPQNVDASSYPSYYYYWNPWWEDVFVVSSAAPYIKLGQTEYKEDWSLYNFREAIPNVSYSSHVQTKGWLPTVENGKLSGTSGQALRMEAIKMNVSNLPNGVSGGIAYSGYIQKIGWQPEKANGEIAGTIGNGYRMEAIKIRLTGELAEKYSVQYRTHIQSKGWSAYSKDNEVSGTTGQALRIEAIEIKLVPR